MQLLYALALIPAGYLADKADRPRLLAAGLALWSVLTMAASKVINYNSTLLGDKSFVQEPPALAGPQAEAPSFN